MTVSLRNLQEDDCQLLFEWRNDPRIVAKGASHSVVTPVEHTQWFLESLQAKKRKVFVIEYDCGPIGQVRYDRLSEASFKVSIFLAPDYQGKGFGSAALVQSIQWMAENHGRFDVIADVVADNELSLSFFKKHGFQLDESVKDGTTLRLVRKIANVNFAQ